MIGKKFAFLVLSLAFLSRLQADVSSTASASPAGTANATDMSYVNQVLANAPNMAMKMVSPTIACSGRPKSRLVWGR